MSTLLVNGLLFSLSGACVGLLAGILGIGGGIIIVPILLMIFHNSSFIPPDQSIHFSIGTSLAIMLFTSQASSHAHYKHGEVMLPIFWRLVGGIGLGTLTGGIVAFFMPSNNLRFLLAIFLFSVAIKMILDKGVPRPQRFPGAFVNNLVCYSIGSLAGLLGISGGVLLLPYLSYCGIETRKIAGILALCTMTVSFIGTMTYITTGLFEPTLPTWSTGFVYWPAVFCMAIPGSLTAPIGARLSYVLPVKQIRYAFICLLMITAISLLPDGVHAYIWKMVS
jgi:uncharacterized membrane protein YfcA